MGTDSGTTARCRDAAQDMGGLSGRAAVGRREKCVMPMRPGQEKADQGGSLRGRLLFYKEQNIRVLSGIWPQSFLQDMYRLSDMCTEEVAFTKFLLLLLLRPCSLGHFLLHPTKASCRGHMQDLAELTHAGRNMRSYALTAEGSISKLCTPARNKTIRPKANC